MLQLLVENRYALFGRFDLTGDFRALPQKPIDYRIHALSVWKRAKKFEGILGALAT